MLGLGVCGAFIFESQPMCIYALGLLCLVLLFVLLLRRIPARCSFFGLQRCDLDPFRTLFCIVLRMEKYGGVLPLSL